MKGFQYWHISIPRPYDLEDLIPSVLTNLKLTT